MKNKSEEEIKKLLEELNFHKYLSLEQAYKRLAPVGLEFEEGGTRLSIMQVYFSKYGWAAATDGYILGILPIEKQEKSFGFQTKLNKHKTDEIDITPERIKISCDHKNDKSGIVNPLDQELHEVPDLLGVLPNISEWSQNTSFNSLKGGRLKILSQALSEESIVKIFSTNNHEQICLLGQEGFGTMMCMTDEEDLKIPEVN